MSQLTQNTADLDALIAKANALPDAGSGGGAGLETCTVIIDTTPSTTQKITLLQYTTVDSDGNVTEGIIKNVADNAYPVSITCVCNTPISGILPFTSNDHSADTSPIRCYQIVKISSSDLAFFYGLVTLEKGETGTFVW